MEVTDDGLRIIVDRYLNAHQCRVLCSVLMMSASQMEPTAGNPEYVISTADLNRSLEVVCSNFESGDGQRG